VSVQLIPDFLSSTISVVTGGSEERAASPHSLSPTCSSVSLYPFYGRAPAVFPFTYIHSLVGRSHSPSVLSSLPLPQPVALPSVPGSSNPPIPKKFQPGEMCELRTGKRKESAVRTLLPGGREGPLPPPHPGPGQSNKMPNMDVAAASMEKSKPPRPPLVTVGESQPHSSSTKGMSRLLPEAEQNEARLPWQEDLSKQSAEAKNMAEEERVAMRNIPPLPPFPDELREVIDRGFHSLPPRKSLHKKSYKKPSADEVRMVPIHNFLSS